MKTYVIAAVAGAFALAACDSRTPEPTPEPADTAAQATTSAPTLPPPRRDEFAAAWAEACPDAEQVGKALCKSKGLADPNFTCDFALGDGEYRRHTAELQPGTEKWELANPAQACSVN